MGMTGLTQRADLIGHWQFRLKIAGRRYSRSFAARTEREAERLARAAVVEIEAEAARAQVGTPSAVHMSQVLDEFKRKYVGTRKHIVEGTHQSYRDSLTYFERFFVEKQCDPLVDAVNKGMVQAYFDWRLPRRAGGPKTTVSQRTLRKDYAVLHLVFAFAVEREWRPANPVDQVKQPPKGDSREPIVLSEEQGERLLAVCREHDDPMLYMWSLTCYETATRPDSEALWIQWPDIDFRRGLLRVVSGRDGHTTKGRQSRTLPLSKRLLEAFRDHFARYRLAGGSPWVFHHTVADRRAEAGDRIVNLRRSFQTAARIANLPPGVWPYDLRHTRITRWVADGHNLAKVQKAAGHRSIRTTMMYVHLVDDDLSELVAGPPARRRSRRANAQ